MTAPISKCHGLTRADSEGVTGARSLQNALVQLQEANAKAEGLAGVVAIRQDECRHYQEQAGPPQPYPTLPHMPYCTLSYVAGSISSQTQHKEERHSQLSKQSFMTPDCYATEDDQARDHTKATRCNRDACCINSV